MGGWGQIHEPAVEARVMAITVGNEVMLQIQQGPLPRVGEIVQVKFLRGGRQPMADVYPLVIDETEPYIGGGTLTPDEYERRRAETS